MTSGVSQCKHPTSPRQRNTGDLPNIVGLTLVAARLTRRTSWWVGPQFTNRSRCRWSSDTLDPNNARERAESRLGSRNLRAGAGGEDGRELVTCERDFRVESQKPIVMGWKIVNSRMAF
jgi:hypothetical protein